MADLVLGRPSSPTASVEAGDVFLQQIFGHNKPSLAVAFSPPRHLPPLAAIFNQIRYATPHLFARSLQSAHPYQSSLLLLHGAIGNRGPPPAAVARARPNQMWHAPSLCSIMTEPSLERTTSSSVSSILKRSITCCPSLSPAVIYHHEQMLLLSAGHLCRSQAVSSCYCCTCSSRRELAAPSLAAS
ncbi:hypothetical protein B296_00023858 [Ensete ventricosum]|uniref:Uncharacterized protein n=1 Tax=Ensete ventricosum TaxID=4639 RepID=A0A426XBM4_ENSVE|nr:hypothetical protein B296_00023858 [Ensete ventricosum]